MSIISTTRSDLVFGNPGSISLPRNAPGFQNGIAGFADISFSIPTDAQTEAVLAFTYVTGVGHEASVDLQFSLSAGGFNWGLGTRSVEFRSMHWLVGLSPGKDNVLRFNLDKGGSIQGTDAIFHSFGGAGNVVLQNLVIYCQRSQREQEHWRWCKKCQGMFFGDNAGSGCPKGGSHDSTGSGDYHLVLK